LKYRLSQLKKESQDRLREIRREVLTDLHALEKDQEKARASVRKALVKKDTKTVKVLSETIRNNRRKPDGLRDLNTFVLNICSMLR
jgi:hypothetical protein